MAVPTGKGPGDFPSLLEASKNCTLHKEQEVVSFCRKRDQLICAQCTSENEQSRGEIIDLETAARALNVSSTLSDVDAKIESSCKLIEIVLRGCTAHMSELSQRKMRIRNQITDLRKNVTPNSKDEEDRKKVSCLQTIEGDLRKELDNKYEECCGKIDKRKSCVQGRYRALQSWRSEMKTLLRSVLSSPKDMSSKIQLFKAAKFLRSETCKDEIELKDFKAQNSNSKLTFHPTEQSSDMNSLPTSLGSISIGESFLVDLFKANVLGAKTIFKGCFIPNRRLLLSEENAKTLYVCNYDGSEFTKIPVEYSPKGVTIYNTGTALIGAWSEGVQIFDLDSLKPGNYIKVGCYVNVITSRSNRICIKRSADVLDTITIKGMLQKKINTSFPIKDACVAIGGYIFCTDYDSSDVRCVEDSDLQHTVYSSPDLKCPNGITIDSSGDIYVADYLSNNIHKISDDGKKHKIVLSYDDGIRKPTALSFNQWTDELMVVNDDGLFVKIYKLPDGW